MRAGGRVRVALGLALLAAVAGLVAGPGGRGRAVAWQQVHPGGGTLCGRGGPFAFWARLASPERLLVYFEGGGFCWDYRSCAPAAARLPDWIPAVRALGPGRFTMPRLYHAVAGRYPRSTFAQVNFRQDAVQRAYFEAAGGRPGDSDQALLGNLAEIHAGTPSFRSYLLDGSDHCALPSDGFYRLRSGETTLRDWVADLAAGRDVPDLPPT